jgi:hypothetical protein
MAINISLIADHQMAAILLIKSQKIAHQAGYYLLQGRWHSLKGKPAPKGAAVAAHPYAAGEHAPAKHFSDEEWAQLKLPDDNVNAGTYNKQLDKLKQHSEAGHVTGIVGSGFGTNTYGKKLSTIANKLLDMHGSQHKVTPGQKAGEHPAVKQQSPTKSAHAENGNWTMPIDDALAEHKDLVHAAETPSKADDKAELDEQKAELEKIAVAAKKAKADKKAKSEKPAKSDLGPAPEFDDTYGKAKYYVETTAKIQAMISDGDTAGIEEWKAKNADKAVLKGKTTNSKIFLNWLNGKQPEEAKPSAAAEPKQKEDQPKKKYQAIQTKKGTFRNKDGQWQKLVDADEHGELPPSWVNVGADQANSAISEKMSSAAKEISAAGLPASNVSMIPWDKLKLPDTNTNAGTFNKKLAAIKQAAESGDLAALEAMTFGKNTYNIKAAKIAATAIAALKEEPAKLEPKQEPKAEDKPSEPEVAKPSTGWDPTPPVLTEKYWKELLPSLSMAIKMKAKSPIKMMIENNKMADSEDGKSLLSYAQSALAHLYTIKPDKPSPTSDHWKEVAKKVEDAIKQKDTETLSSIIDKSKGLGSKDAINVNNYAVDALDYLNHNNEDLDTSKLSAAFKDAEANGPQEGDTKEGADGSLIFHNGRWHKQEAKAAANPSEMQIPDFGYNTSAKQQSALYQAATALKSKAVSEGKAGFKGVITNHANGTVTVKIDGYHIKKLSDMSLNPSFAAFAKFVKDLQVSAGVKLKNPAQVAPVKQAKPAPSNPAPAKPAVNNEGVEKMDGWEQTGPQAGSNAGGKFKDADGVEWYCKFPGDEDTAKAEVLAAKLYAATGTEGQDAKLVSKDGKLGIASRWVNVKKGSAAELAKSKGAHAGFAVDAWLANWDVVGLELDNLQLDEKGHAVRVDAGGSLMYRAQGGKKAFGDNVTELDSLRDAKINPQSAAVFSNMTDADITASVARVAKIPDSTIRKIVMNSGFGDEQSRKDLANTLIARKNDLIAKYPKSIKNVKKRLNPDALPIDESMLPKRHDFENWNGAGKGLSSQPHINAANKAVEAEMHDLAKQGNLSKLKDFKYHEIDKNTGNATGKLIPIDEHPSKHVQQLHSDLVQMLDEIANPPQPLKIFRETDVGTLDELDAIFPPKKFGTTVGKVSSNEKLGFWVVLGGIAAETVAKLKPAKVFNYDQESIQAAFAKYKQASPLAKHFINSVQASGSYNDLFRDGKKQDHQGNNLEDVAKAALEQATSMPEGTSIYRWQNMPDEMVKKMLSAPDGSIIQATGPMCTSYDAQATKHFGKHKITIRYAKGAKAVESFGSGNFSSEKEVTTLPNARFVVLKKEMVDDSSKGGKRLEIELLMLPPDLGL